MEPETPTVSGVCLRGRPRTAREEVDCEEDFIPKKCQNMVSQGPIPIFWDVMGDMNGIPWDIMGYVGHVLSERDVFLGLSTT